MSFTTYPGAQTAFFGYDLGTYSTEYVPLVESITRFVTERMVGIPRNWRWFHSFAHKASAALPATLAYPEAGKPHGGPCAPATAPSLQQIRQAKRKNFIQSLLRKD